MTTRSKKLLKLFYCYARQDKALRDELDIHLSSLKRQNIVTSWYDGEILPGSEWEKEIDTQLRAAHLILLLITPHFIASDYCYGIEMEKALQRHQGGTARVIPIILRHTNWEDAPFSSLQVLPTNAKPITQWSDRDEAFLNITIGIKKAITELQLLLKTPQEWFNEGVALHQLKHYEEAIAAYDEAILLNPNDALAYYEKGVALHRLERYEEAIATYDEAIRLNPNDAEAYHWKGSILHWFKHYEEALAAYEQAIRLDPNLAPAYNNKGSALSGLKRYKEALAAYEQAIRLDPNFTKAWINKGDVLYSLKRYEEALIVSEQIIRLDATYAEAYGNKGEALYGLKRYEEALAAYEQAIRLDPNYAAAYNWKGHVLDKLKRSKEAQQCYEKASQLGYNRYY